ncbi:MAG: leucine-rich repeat domain-containing protein [Bacteroidota bacterium]
MSVKGIRIGANGQLEETTDLTKVLAIGQNGLIEVDATASSGSGWQPHPDWIDISDVNDNEINLLVSDGGVGIAFAVTVAANGTYAIDWGDGTIETNRASGTTYAHQYTVGSGKPVNGGQYTVFKIRIYGATGDITRFQMKKHPNYTRPTYAPLLWAVFGTQYITDYSNTFYTGGQVDCRALQACTIPSFASCSNTSAMFYNCSSLSSVTLPTSWGNVTSASDMFYNCSSLSSVTLPASWGNVTNTSAMFYNCSSLSSVTLPTSWGNVTNTNAMFQYCYSLRIINNLEYLGSQTNASDFTDFLKDAQALTGTLTIASKLSRIGIYGASGYNLKCTGIRLTNGTSTWTGSSPQIDVSYCSLDANALNTLFGDLETVTGKTIRITGNPGASTCNTSIATAKGWAVTN